MSHNSRILPMVRFIRSSLNRKTGIMPVSSTQSPSCPSTCPFMNSDGQSECYGAAHHSGKHWRDLDNASEEKGNILEWFSFVGAVARLPFGTTWRHNEVGDLPHHLGQINEAALAALVHANRKKFGFTFSHHLLTHHNVRLMRMANDGGFTVNVSCDTPHDAIAVMRQHGLPAVTLLPKSAPNSQWIEGVQIVACPHEKNPDRIKCVNCRLCTKADRKFIIGFRPHSIFAAVAERIAGGTA